MDRNFEDLSSYYEYYDGLKEYDFSKQLGIAINGNDFKITQNLEEKSTIIKMRNSPFVVSSGLGRIEEMISQVEGLSVKMLWSQGIEKKDGRKITNESLTQLELESQKEKTDWGRIRYLNDKDYFFPV